MRATGFSGLENAVFYGLQGFIVVAVLLLLIAVVVYIFTKNQQFPEAVGTLSSPCLFISRYVKLKPHPARLSSFPIGGFYGNRGT